MRALPVLSLAGLVLTAPAGAAAAARPVATVRVGQAAFWSDTAPRAARPAKSDCLSCAYYELALVGRGARLRVAVDGPFGGSLRLYDPGGRLASAAGGSYSAEAYAALPRPGRWTVEVDATKPYRVRAKLEATVPEPRGGRRLLLPNLRLVPPYDFALSPATVAQPTGAASCNGYERVEYGARRCLRFSLGPANAGAGPFLLRIPAEQGLVLPGPVYQVIRRGDGTFAERRAGTGLFHRTHAHYHHNGFGSLELLEVVDRRRGTLVRAGAGPKQGFCMIDFMIAEWRTFRNEAMGASGQDCSLLPVDGEVRMGLSAGWADIYTQELDGNYVELGDHGDGYYVVRSTADAEDVVLEADETDNTGYAYVRIRGAVVTVLERGHGTSPWDPRKRLADDLLT